MKFKEEKGSMAVYTLVVLLSMLLILTALFLTSSSVRKSQIETVIKIKQTYEADNSKAAEIYASLTGTGGGSEPDTGYVQEGLILHYDAINNTGDGHSSSATTWKDLSGNGNDGTITGGTWSSQSLRFTSSSENGGVKTKSNFPLNFQNNTFNLVFNLSSVSDVEALFGARNSSSDGFMFFNYRTNNNIRKDTKGSGTRAKVGERLSANTKYNLTLTLENGTSKLYLNGTLAYTSSYTPASISFPLTIFNAGGRSNALGTIYSVKVYDRALTEEEVKRNYQIDEERYKASYIEDGLVLHYDAVNNTGDGHSSTTTTWKDLSGNGNDGTLSTSPSNSTFYWENNSLTISGHGGNLQYYVDTPLRLTGQERTYIYTIDANNLQGSIWGETDSSNTNGLFNYYNFIVNRGSKTTTQNRYDYTFAKSGIYNYAVTLSNSQLKFYVNGVLTQTINNTVGLTCSSNLRLMAARYSRQNATNLKMYQFLAYDRALSDSEILQNYNVSKEEYNINT